MGATLNLRPDLYRAAILGVPFVDVLTTMLDDTIPLTTTEVLVSAASKAAPSLKKGLSCGVRLHTWGDDGDTV